MFFDLILIVILSVCIYLGYKRGFARSLCNMCSLLVSFIVAIMLYGVITNFIMDSFIGEFLIEKVGTSLASYVGDKAQIPEFLQSIITVGSGNVSFGIAESIARMIVSIISIILTIIVVKILVNMLFKLINLVAKLPVLKQCNKVLGTVFGVIIGLFWVCIVVYAVSCMAFIPATSFMQGLISDSDIAALIFKNGFMLGLFS